AFGTRKQGLCVLYRSPTPSRQMLAGDTLDILCMSISRKSMLYMVGIRAMPLCRSRAATSRNPKYVTPLLGNAQMWLSLVFTENASCDRCGALAGDDDPLPARQVDLAGNPAFGL